MLPAQNISGLTLAVDPVTPSTVIVVTPGVARDDANTRDMGLSSPTSLSFDGVSAGTYHVFIIGGDGMPDAVFGSPQPDYFSLPSGYTSKRRLGAVIVNGSGILPFHQYGDKFVLDVSVATAASVSTTAAFATLCVPTGIQVEAFGDVSLNYASANGYSAVTSPDTPDAPASLSNFSNWVTADSQVSVNRFECFTNVNGQVRVRSSMSSGQVHLVTRGWRDLL